MTDRANEPMNSRGARRYCFLSGLPRSGSTLIAAILKQNPRLTVTVQSPVIPMFTGLKDSISPLAEPLKMTSAQRVRIFRAAIGAYYDDAAGDVIVDGHRDWCGWLALLAQMFPDGRVICCVRNPAWIIDSTERIVRNNPAETPRMFAEGPQLSVYNRLEQMKASRYLGGSMQALRHAWFSEHARMLIAVRYESLVDDPPGVIARLYAELGEPAFEHDFSSFSHDEPELDGFLGMPGMHSVRAPVVRRQRQTILPPDIFAAHDNAFWDRSDQNPHGVTIL